MTVEPKILIGELFDSIYRGQVIEKIAFVDYPQFQWEADLGPDELERLEKDVERFGDYSVAWSGHAIQAYLPKMSWQKNIVCFFPKFGKNSALHLKEKCWELVYHCYDRLDVELFTSSSEVAGMIQALYQVESIGYPGRISGPGGFDVET